MNLAVSVASDMTRPPAHTVFGAQSARARSEKSTAALYNGCTVPLAACPSRAVVQRPEAVSHVRHASQHRRAVRRTRNDACRLEAADPHSMSML